MERYPVERLIQLKQKHESRHGEDPFAVDMSIIVKIREGFSETRRQIRQTYEESKIPRDLRIPFDELGEMELFSTVRSTLSRIKELLQIFSVEDEKVWEEFLEYCEDKGVAFPDGIKNDYYENPLRFRNWDLHTYAVPNTLSRLEVLLDQLELAYLEHYLCSNPTDPNARRRKEQVSEVLAQKFETRALVD